LSEIIGLAARVGLIYYQTVMGAQDIAKDAIRIATTAGLSKDVIDLLKEKVALLTEQIETLETEKANLKQKVADLGQELERLRPKGGGLEEGAEKFLKLLFDHRQPLSLPQIASGIGALIGTAEYHRDKLWELDMITSAGIAEQDYELMPEGREYVVKYLLKK
jgi:hypothetical protein